MTKIAVIRLGPRIRKDFVTVYTSRVIKQKLQDEQTIYHRQYYKHP